MCLEGLIVRYYWALLCLCLLLALRPAATDDARLVPHDRSLLQKPSAQTLDAALAALKLEGQQLVTVDANVSLAKPVAITAEGAMSLAIKGGANRPFVICAEGMDGVAIVLTGVKLTISNVGFTGCTGGVVAVAGPSASLALQSVDVTGCSGGKALFSVDGSLAVDSSRMYNNKAQLLLSFTGKAGKANNTAKISASQFTDNEAEGVLSLSNPTTLALNLTQMVPAATVFEVKGDTTTDKQLVVVSISGSKFMRNALEDRGFVVKAQRVDLEMDDCEFTENVNFGGMISIHQGALELTNSRLVENRGAPSLSSTPSHLLKASEGKVGLAALRGCTIDSNKVDIGIDLPAFTDYRRGFKEHNKTDYEGRAQIYSNTTVYNTYADLLAVEQQYRQKLLADKRDNPLVLENCTVTGNTFLSAGIYAVFPEGDPKQKMSTSILLTNTAFTNNEVKASTHNADSVNGGTGSALNASAQGNATAQNGLVVVQFSMLLMDQIQVSGNTAPSVFLVLQALANLTNSNFTDNTAAEDGWVFRTFVATAFCINVTMEDNKGGGILSLGQASSWLAGLKVSGNTAEKHVVEVFDTQMPLGPSSFTNNKAGGAVLHFNNSYFSPMDSFNFNDNKAGKGVLVVESFFTKFPTESALFIRQTNFTDNQVNGSDGGAALVGPKSNQWSRLDFIDCSFTNNKMVPNDSAAQPKGAALSSQGLHSMVVDGCSFKDNAALVNGSGGAIFTSSRMEINNTVFENNIATWMGGAVACSGCPHLRIHNVSFTNNTAKGAGALMLASAGEKSNVEQWNRMPNSITNSTFTDNAASVDGIVKRDNEGGDIGGEEAFAGDGASCFPGAGGAMCVHPRWNTTIGNCTITKNQAKWGGAMFVNNGGLSSRAVCLLTLCTNTLSANAISGGSGSAVFLTSVGSTICQECGTNCTKAAENQGKFDECSYWTDNTASLGSPTNRTISTGPLSVNVDSPNDARSGALTKRGAPIAAKVQLLDFYNETINYLLPYTAVIRVSHVSSDKGEKVIVSRYKKVQEAVTQYNMSQDAVMLGEDTQKNRSYSLIFTIDGEESTQGAKLDIRLRSCLPGERQTESVGCYDCDSYTFIQDPEIAQCFQCPDGGDCIGQVQPPAPLNRGVLAPKAKYWQSTPHSPQIHACRLDNSCHGQGRASDEILRGFLAQHNDRFLRMWVKPTGAQSKVVRTAHAERVLNVTAYRELVAEYNELQCADGYTGNLCGVCKEGYGRWTNRCVRCISRVVNNIFIVMACLLLLALLSFTIFSHIKVAEQQGQGLSTNGPGAANVGVQGVQGPGVVSLEPGAVLRTGRSVDSVSSGKMEDVDMGLDPRQMDVLPGRDKAGRVGGVAGLRDSLQAMTLDPNGRSKAKMMQSIAKIMISYVQVLSITRNVQLAWPSALKRFISGLDFTSGPSDYIALDCSLTGSLENKAYMRTIIMSTLPLVLVAGAIVFWLGSAIFRPRPSRQTMSFRQYFSVHVILTVVQICYYLYPLVSSSLLQVFTCQELDDSGTRSGKAYSSVTPEYLITGSYWTQNFNIKCWQGGHALLAKALALPGVLLFCIGFPLVTTWLLFHNRRKLDDYRVVLKYGFLYEEYQEQYYFWEAVILFRKAGILVCTIFLRPHGPIIQLITVGLITLACVLLQEIYRPFGSPLLNQLERLSLISIAANVLTLGYFLPWSQCGQTTRLLLTVLLIVGNVVVAVFFLTCLAAVAFAVVQSWLAGKGILTMTRSQISRGVNNRMSKLDFVCGGKKNQPVV